MNEILITILNETQSDLSGRIEILCKVIEQHKTAIREKKQELERMTDKLKCAVYEDGQTVQKISVLQEYLSRLDKPVPALENKLKMLGDERESTEKNRKEADSKVESVRHDIRSRQTQLAVCEQEEEKLRNEWSEISKLIYNERTN